MQAEATIPSATSRYVIGGSVEWERIAADLNGEVIVGAAACAPPERDALREGRMLLKAGRRR